MAGIRKEMSFADSKQVSLINKGSLIAAFVALLFAIYSYTLPAYELLILDISCIVLTLICIAINDLKFYRWAKVQLAVTCNIAILLKACMLGEASNTHYLLFPTITAIMMMFDLKEKVLSMLLVMLPVLVLGTLDYNNYSLVPTLSLKHADLIGLRILNMVSTLSSLILITYLFLDTSTKQTKQLVKARKQLKAIFDNSFDAIFTVDGTDLTIMSCNQRSAKLFDCEQNENMNGRSILSVLANPLSKTESQDIHRQLTKFHKFSKEYECISTRGRKFWGNLAITMFMVDYKPMYLIRITDVTFKKLQEERISRNEAALSEAQRLAKMGSFEYDVDSSTTYVSDELKNILGYPKGVVVDGPTYIANVHPDYRQEVRAIFLDSIQKDEIFDLEYPYIRPIDGKTIYLRGYGKVFKDREGRNRRFIGSVQDVTAAKVKETELINARKAAEEASKVKEEFLSVMSHEIRTPLNAVIGMTHLLLQENPRPSQMESLKTLKFSADNLLSLVNDILDFSKIEAGKISLEEIPFNLRDLVNTIKYSQLYRVEEKKISLEIIIDPAIPEQIIGDPVRISQILSNLVSNAVKFTNIGKVVLDISLQAEDNSTYLLGFKVQDTGIGIPKDKHAYIFENFTQASASTTRKYGGTGLGLAITKRLLTLLNSEIHLESEEGIGSTFSFEIGFKKHLPSVNEGMISNELIPYLNLSELRLLLVEDNAFNQLVASSFLKQWGIQPHTANNGRQALDLLQENVYDIILMDLQMPEMDGYEAAKKIRQSKDVRINKVPIIAFTASAMLDVEGKILRAGMNDVITKPFNPHDLYFKVVKYLPDTMLPTEKQNLLTADKPVLSRYINFDKIIRMSAGSKDTEKEFIELYIESMHALKEDYISSMANSDLKRLQGAIHKASVILSMIEASQLLADLNEAKELLATSQTDSPEATRNIKKVCSKCESIVNELKRKLAERHSTPLNMN